MAAVVVDHDSIYSTAGRNDRPQADLERIPTLQDEVAQPLERAARQLSALARMVQNAAALVRDGDELTELDPEEIVAVVDGAGEAIDAAHGAIVDWYENELNHGTCVVIDRGPDAAAFRELVRAIPEQEGKLRLCRGWLVVSAAVRFLAGQPNAPLLLAELQAGRDGAWDGKGGAPGWPWTVVKAARERGETAAAEAVAACSSPERMDERRRRFVDLLLDALARANRTITHRMWEAVDRLWGNEELFSPDDRENKITGSADEDIEAAIARANLRGLVALLCAFEEIEREHPDCFAPAGSKPGGGA